MGDLSPMTSGSDPEMEDQPLKTSPIQRTPEVTPEVALPELTKNGKTPEILDEDRHASKYVWGNIVPLFFQHMAAVYGLYLVPSVAGYTILWAYILLLMSGLGVTAGAHRLWSHKTYEARLPLRVLLVIWNTLAQQGDIIRWSRDHRVHHKFSETDADPHNARRGFFFAHCGWLFVRKHPDVTRMGAKIDLSDLYSDRLCVLQQKLYLPGALVLNHMLPAVVPWYFWGESLSNAYLVAGALRYILTLHSTWSVNSLAHLIGNKPYDKAINPAENAFVAFCAMGEGFHNYHHTFPQDYSTSEIPWIFNPTTFFIDVMAFVGLVTRRTRAPPSIVEKRKARTGDGSQTFSVDIKQKLA